MKPRFHAGSKLVAKGSLEPPRVTARPAQSYPQSYPHRPMRSSLAWSAKVSGVPSSREPQRGELELWTHHHWI